MTRGVFRAGFNWRVIDNKWTGFEAAFHGFDPPLNAAMSEEEFDAHLKDTGIIRNAQKVASVRANAQFLVDLAGEHGSAAKFFADWPDSDFIGLLDLMKKRAARCAGETAMRFFRTMGKPSFITTRDVAAALIEAGVIDKPPSGRKDFQAVQDAFNGWSAGDRPRPHAAQPRAGDEHRAGLRARGPDGPPLILAMSDPRNVRSDAFVGTAEAYARWRPPYPVAMLDELLREAGIGPGARLLDLATGPGRIALALADRFAEVWALDLEPEMIAVGARRRRAARDRQCGLVGRPGRGAGRARTPFRPDHRRRGVPPARPGGDRREGAALAEGRRRFRDDGRRAPS